MNRERLELMCTLLTEVEAGTWEPTGTLGEGVPLPLPKREGHRFDLDDWLNQVQPDCGFSACAIGHAGMDARFNAQRMRLHWRSSVLYSHCPLYPHGGEVLEGWDAVCAFFDLTPGQADSLFAASCYPLNQRTSPAAVRQRIEKLLIKN